MDFPRDPVRTYQTVLHGQTVTVHVYAPAGECDVGGPSHHRVNLGMPNPSVQVGSRLQIDSGYYESPKLTYQQKSRLMNGRKSRRKSRAKDAA